jgi:hypothetical protein
MILTDKCKEEFEKWIDYDLFNYNYRLDKTMQQSKIIEFFDSINIFIVPYICSDDLWDYDVTDIDKKCIANGLAYKSRTEATQSAILKANEIFNNLNK